MFRLKQARKSPRRIDHAGTRRLVLPFGIASPFDIKKIPPSRGSRPGGSTRLERWKESRPTGHEARDRVAVSRLTGRKCFDAWGQLMGRPVVSGKTRGLGRRKLDRRTMQPFWFGSNKLKSLKRPQDADGFMQGETLCVQRRSNSLQSCRFLWRINSPGCCQTDGMHNRCAWRMQRLAQRRFFLCRLPPPRNDGPLPPCR